MENLSKKVEKLAQLIQFEYGNRVKREYPDGFPDGIKVKVKAGRRWIKVDVDTSGKYMVDRDGTIYGIKAYGVPHFGYRFGNLDTIQDWDWSGYRAIWKQEKTG